MSSSPSSMALDAMVEEHLGDGRLGLAFGELELGVLELDDLLAERLALLDVIDRSAPARAPSSRRRARATISRSCGSSFMSWSKPCPSSVPSRFSAGSVTSSKNSSDVSAESRPSFLSLRPRRKPGASSVSTTISETPLAPLLRVGLGDDDDQVGVLAVGDEGLGAVEHIAVAGLLDRGGPHALQVGAGAGLAHGDGADQFAGRELRQPALLLLLGAVVQDVGRDDAGMQRRAERVEAGEAVLAVDHRLMGEACRRRRRIPPASMAHSRPACAGLGPDLARIHAGRRASLSRCGTNSAARKRRACSSSRTRSSVIQAGRGRLIVFIGRSRANLAMRQ